MRKLMACIAIVAYVSPTAVGAQITSIRCNKNAGSRAYMECLAEELSHKNKDCAHENKCLEKLLKEFEKRACASKVASPSNSPEYEFCRIYFGRIRWELANRNLDNVKIRLDSEFAEKEARETEKRARRERELRLPQWARNILPKIQKTTRVGAFSMTPTEVYQEVSRSVYVVRSGETSARIELGEGRLGSAVAISGNLALTNCHVIKDSPEIYVHRPMGVFSAEHSFRVKVESADEMTDRCVLRVLQSPRDELWFDAIASIRANSSVEIGERVYTIGNPQGLTNPSPRVLVRPCGLPIV